MDHAAGCTLTNFLYGRFHQLAFFNVLKERAAIALDYLAWLAGRIHRNGVSGMIYDISRCKFPLLDEGHKGHRLFLIIRRLKEI